MKNFPPSFFLVSALFLFHSSTHAHIFSVWGEMNWDQKTEWIETVARDLEDLRGAQTAAQFFRGELKTIQERVALRPHSTPGPEELRMLEQLAKKRNDAFVASGWLIRNAPKTELRFEEIGTFGTKLKSDSALQQEVLLLADALAQAPAFISVNNSTQFAEQWGREYRLLGSDPQSTDLKKQTLRKMIAMRIRIQQSLPTPKLRGTHPTANLAGAVQTAMIAGPTGLIAGAVGSHYLVPASTPAEMVMNTMMGGLAGGLGGAVGLPLLSAFRDGALNALSTYSNHRPVRAVTRAFLNGAGLYFDDCEKALIQLNLD